MPILGVNQHVEKVLGMISWFDIYLAQSRLNSENHRKGFDFLSVRVFGDGDQVFVERFRALEVLSNKFVGLTHATSKC